MVTCSLNVACGHHTLTKLPALVPAHIQYKLSNVLCALLNYSTSVIQAHSRPLKKQSNGRVGVESAHYLTGRSMAA